MKYKQKPIEVEAFRFGHDPIPDWFKLSEDTIIGIEYLGITSPVGLLKAYLGDYVIKGKDYIYPCSANVFEAIFGEVD